MQKVPPSPGHCKPLREERDGARKGSRFPQMPRPLSDGWPQRSQVPVRRTRSRQESTLRCYGGPGRISPLRSGGSRRARAFRTTRSPTSGPSPRQRSQTPEGWSAWDRGEGNATPPGLPAHLKRETPEKKWAEARQWAGAGSGRQEEVQKCRDQQKPVTVR